MASARFVFGLAAAPRGPSSCCARPVHARGTRGREEEDDVAREGEMAAENKPEGLKKVRNPDRMYRTAVCYAGHGPPKSISDDTEMNSKSYSCAPHRCSKRPPADHCVMTSSVYPLTF
ncbi:hypothetical protein NHX12_012888 [Muraenolepis orangiensis]|uniref:Uncharacterized protein n=1 Tax=Muraenolepis orangiensis TaxID=630683 RepID=A0A9Q0DGC1_9TELE|nr:hypothetical protein NHX12_012888 [Muraenolepis orangiensis]